MHAGARVETDKPQRDASYHLSRLARPCAAASFTSAAVPEALLEGFNSRELKESVQYYRQFFEERFHVNRRGRQASKRAIALQVTVVRRRPEQAGGQGSLRPFAELAAPVAMVSAKEHLLYRAPLDEVGSIELSQFDTSCLLSAERAQLLELPYVAFGATLTHTCLSRSGHGC